MSLILPFRTLGLKAACNEAGYKKTWWSLITRSTTASQTAHSYWNVSAPCMHCLWHILAYCHGRSWLSEQIATNQLVSICRQMALRANWLSWQWILNCRSVMRQTGLFLPANTHGTSNINRSKHSSVSPWQEQTFGLSHRCPPTSPPPHCCFFSLLSCPLFIYLPLSRTQLDCRPASIGKALS